ncbi:septum formation protein Maf [Phocaeicola barnesiae]|jgi:septum formation protein|uniref:dTTP/UTP pyrophosphatase n=1 Tax=Phocaeicola barnesiae TaxID=376804 RepID=A0AAW5N8B6_9BACT|nr:Maf-like protein [Phocaeicola barnesiae]CDD32827.1 maf-like protein BACCOP_01390 [Bacteroides sp. CAG:714]MCF2577087.1 septum formation protein Maf [Phocaeicola barnesiae]MCF2599109.1 septum formation protein Maf [Phocaeicola barnesiae]MCR8873489.1 Maf-like protein [Phocaeicola barnesiae]MDM8233941.1 Maf-like protein [Phocaeicola barnesiae]
MLENLQKYRIRLASNSPRRRELLSGLGIDYEVKLLPDIDETYPDTLKGEEIPLFIAREKAAAYLPSMESDELIITADTIVYVDDEVLGKPKDEADARRMLHLLSGRSHQVITGVCISARHFQRAFAATTEVTFDTLSEEEIDFYVRTYRPMDKAGSYGIQEWIGYIGVCGMKGSYFNVMGLPVQRLYQELKKC